MQMQNGSLWMLSMEKDVAWCFAVIIVFGILAFIRVVFWSLSFWINSLICSSNNTQHPAFEFFNSCMSPNNWNWLVNLPTLHLNMKIYNIVVWIHHLCLPERSNKRSCSLVELSSGSSGIFSLIGSNKTFTSSMTLISAPALISGGKNSQKLVATTKPTVSGTDAAQCSRHRPENTDLTPTSTTKHTPCSTKKDVISHDGLTRLT